MDSIKDYQTVLRETKRKCSLLLESLSQTELMELALRLGKSHSSLMNYKAMKGSNIKTMLVIINSIEKSK
jgi:hypothetical protein